MTSEEYDLFMLSDNTKMTHHLFGEKWIFFNLYLEIYIFNLQIGISIYLMPRNTIKK